MYLLIPGLHLTLIEQFGSRMKFNSVYLCLRGKGERRRTFTVSSKSFLYYYVFSLKTSFSA